MLTLKQQLEKVIDISSKEWQEISSHFIKRTFAKSETIFQSGEIMDVVFYLASGVANAYVINDDGKAFIWQIYYNHPDQGIKNALLDDCVSYDERTPSLLNFEALEETECYEISRAYLEKLYTTDIKWQYLGRMLTQSAYANAYRRVISSMTRDAASRLEELLRDHPNIFERVKAYHVAAYLGITPQSLSRLRKNITIGE